MTVNWHDRSIAPERLWNDFYYNMLDDLKSREAWFTTAAGAVAWFRKRRSAIFETIRLEPGALNVKVSVDSGDDLPGLRLRVHKRRRPCTFVPVGTKDSDSYIDIAMNDSIEKCVPI